MFYVKRWEEAKDVDKMKPNLSVRLQDIRKTSWKNMERKQAFAEYAFNKSHSTAMHGLPIKQLI
jgi:DNA polymerase III alpha subunit